jgi:hypothetical protein
VQLAAGEETLAVAAIAQEAENSRPRVLRTKEALQLCVG